MSSVDVVITGNAAGILAMLNKIDSAFSPVGMARFMNTRVVPELRERARGRFAQEGDDASGKWAPLSPATVSIRQAGIDSGHFVGITASHPINVRTGDMEEYITQGSGDITHEGIGNISLHYPSRSLPSKKSIADKVRRAQVGDTRTAKRPVLAVSETDLSFVVSNLAFHIRGRY